MARIIRPAAPPHAQRGLSLLVGLIMLVMLTLFAISAFNVSNVNLRIAGNMQVRQETLAAAQSATEEVLSTPAFIDPATPPADKIVNLNGASYTVKFTPVPACTGVVDIPSEDLDPALPADLDCIPSGAVPGQTSGIFGAGGPPAAPSICANTRWAVTAKAADTAAGTTGTETTLEQGVGVRMAKGKALAKCP